MVLVAQATQIKQNKNVKMLRYLFVRAHQLMVSVGNGDVANFAAVCFLAMTLMINIAALNGIINAFSSSRSSWLPHNKLAGLCFVLGSIAILYWFLVWNDKSISVLKKYENESKRERIQGRHILVSYVVGSIVLLMVSFYLMMKKNRGELY